MRPSRIVLFVLLIPFGFSACQTYDIATDYDHSLNFSQFKTFAFYKPGIDKAPLPDITKRQILRAVDTVLSQKGIHPSKTPDLLVSIGVNSAESGYTYPTAYGDYKETLYINLIDASTNTLIWQGMGAGRLYYSEGSPKEQQNRVTKIVVHIFKHFPPGKR